MTKLWEKEGASASHLSLWRENFTVGSDYLLDAKLLSHDINASKAHAQGLLEAGIFSADEYPQIAHALSQLQNEFDAGSIAIDCRDEDCHTVIENYLTKKLGDIGKKIHAGRSRNDQVQAALRLYYKAEITDIISLARKAARAILNFGKQNEFVPMPGYTHMQKAMPSSVGLWCGALGEAIREDLEFLSHCHSVFDQSPLGSAAGYGTSIPINREAVSLAAGFKKCQANVLAVQNSRLKYDLILVDAIKYLFMSFNKLASDLLFFTTGELNFFSLPDELTTGSSIMPQKRNGDVLELIRAKSSEAAAASANLWSISNNLISGYHRDFQLSKEIVFPLLTLSKELCSAASMVFENLKVNQKELARAMTEDLYAADQANKLAMEKVPFREAYQSVVKKLTEMSKPFAVTPPEAAIQNLKQKKNLGSPGNLRLDELMKMLEDNA